MKPVPSSVRQFVSPNDDEMFLDAENEDFENDVGVDGGKKIKDSEKRRRKRRRRRRGVNDEKYHQHIVYKRSKTTEEDEYSDYGKFPSPHHPRSPHFFPQRKTKKKI